ncbi:leucine-rich repeat and coiled-coil domain-containing protein 1-like [Clytia hemisphaerica]|uniref:Leucine-rich repeat and coiled-coil domain-containing protein 1 n=1 Tax=Clytia hemisphaerica TaxID=252671 RepID=A0A7M5X1M8_9CNID
MCSNQELCLIDSGITSLDEVNLSDALVNLNLHCNHIREVGDQLTHHKTLKYLDLSSNKLKEISGLSGCVNLQFLNLASNYITKVKGIDRLRRLKKLNLTFNQIDDLTGLKAFRKSSHSLQHVELYSNRLNSLKHVIECLSSCNCLQKIELRQGKNTNPICGVPAYRANILAQLPWLKSLDGMDRDGNQCESSTHTSDVPGLEELLDFLDPEDLLSEPFQAASLSTISKDETVNNDLSTPKIDSVLLKFKERQQPGSFPANENNVDETKDGCEQDAPQKDLMTVDRLHALEKQLEQLTKLYKEKQNSTNKENEIDVHITDTTTTTETYSTDDDDESFPSPPKHTKRKPVPLKQGVLTNKVKPDATSQNKGVSCATTRPSRFQNRKPLTRANPITLHKGKPSKPLSERQVRSAEDDETYLNLIHEIDVERERRWKAEQATRKLLDSLKSLKETLFEERKIQEAAVTFNAKLKEALQKERSVKKTFEDSSKSLQEENERLKSRLSECVKCSKQNEESVKDLHQTCQQLEKEKSQMEIHYTKTLRDLQHDSGGYKRELELLRNTTDKQKEQLQQLQELLILREQEHRTILENKVNIDGTEVSKIVEKEVQKCDHRHRELLNQLESKLAEKNKDYEDLEDEFRMALKIEADRYNKLAQAYEEVNKGADELKQSFGELSNKEAKARSLIADLSSMVKEQKFKISELVKHKQEINKNQMGQIQRLEVEIEPLRRIASKFETLQQDKNRMSAHIKGQDSIIQGLRSERRLWGQELAQQGANLAQERGRLDLQIESQQKEIVSFKNKIHDQEDTINIKNKLIEDQTNSIKKMKDDLRVASEENAKLTVDEERLRGERDEQLLQLKETCDGQQEQIEALVSRKEELKDLLQDTEDQLQAEKKDLRRLKTQWEDRDNLIGKLEEKVIKMKTSFDGKEEKLRKECAELQEQNKIIENSLKEFQEKYERENTTKEHEFNLKMKRLISQKEDEIQMEKEKVIQVEEEMRMILTETAAQKKQLEQRVNKLSKAFNDIQNDLK